LSIELKHYAVLCQFITKVGKVPANSLHIPDFPYYWFWICISIMYDI